MLDITQMEDTSSYACCILLAVRNKIFTDEEISDIADMFEYRELCATQIEVDVPEPGTLERWQNILFRTMSDMFAKAMA
ncbi:MAG: hypothetical protein IKR86_07210 [Candidatus Methanomethylophilaceae archaeon]|nr:hypothetical protein [Candidatus Methanomethylophilaceae archaeon]